MSQGNNSLPPTQGAQPNTQQPQGGGPIPYVGSKISLISKSDIRYEGTLFGIDTRNSTVSLRDVRMFGTEGRREGGSENQIPPIDRVYSYIVFKGSDIKDLTVSEAPKNDFAAPPTDFNAQQPPTGGAQQPPQQPNQPWSKEQEHNPMMYPTMPFNPYMPNYQPFYGYPPRMPYGMPPPGMGVPPPGMGGQFPQAPPTFGGRPLQPEKLWTPPQQDNAPTQPPQQIQPPVQQQPPQQQPVQQPVQQQQPVQPVQPVQQKPQQPKSVLAPPQKKEEPVVSQPVQEEKTEQPKQNQHQGRGGNNRSRRGGRGGKNTQPTSTDANKPVSFDGEFDFQTNLERFNKESILKEIQQLDINTKDETIEAQKKKTPAPIVKPAYDKNSSFFDTISRDSEDKQNRRTYHEREEQHKLDVETFGESGSQGGSRGGRGRGRGRGGGRGGGRGRGGQSHGGQSRGGNPWNRNDNKE